MDPLSILASSAALFEAVKESYRYAKDVIKAPKEREELVRRLDSISSIHRFIQDELDTHPDAGNASWAQVLSPGKNPDSPLAELVEIMNKMLVVLKTNGIRYRKMKNFRWHSEKKSLESFFGRLDSCYLRIVACLSLSNVETSRLTRAIDSRTKLIETMQKAQIDADNLAREETERKAIERWLSPLDFQARQREIFDSAAKTGEWFIRSEEFNIWKEGELEWLRCRGALGTGKASSALYSPRNLLGSLVKQLIQLKESGINPEIRTAWKEATRVDAQPGRDVLTTLLKIEAAQYNYIYVVIDALGEASQKSKHFIERELRQVSHKLKLLTMGRFEEDGELKDVYCSICLQEGRGRLRLPVYYTCQGCPKGARGESRFDVCPSCKKAGHVCDVDPNHVISLPKVIELEITTPETDLELYARVTIRDQFPDDDIDPEMESARRSSTKLGYFCARDEQFFNEIISAILNNSCGKFLLVKQFIKSISTKITRKEIKSTISKLHAKQYNPTDLLDALYKQDLEECIRRQEAGKVNRGIKLLSMVFFAWRQLTLHELQQLWAVQIAEVEDLDYDADGEIDSQDILNSTGGYIIIGLDGIVRLDGQTLREYLNRTKSDWFPEGHKNMAYWCLRYLGFNTFSKPCSIEELDAREEKNPFFSYALQYWGDHAREAPWSSEVKTAAVKDLKDPSRVEAYIQGAWHTNTQDQDKWDVRRDIHAFHVCAWFGLANIVLELNIVDLDVKEKTYGQTPLMYACRRGHHDMVSFLLKLGADVNNFSGRGRARSALHEAVLRKDNRMVDLLLSEGRNIDVNLRQPDAFGRPALMIAILQGSASIAKTISRCGNAEINLQDAHGNTALTLAAVRGMDDVIDALLTLDAKMDLTEFSSGRSALVIASQKNNSSIVHCLLNHGANPDLPKTVKGQTPALLAAEYGALDSLRILISFGTDLSLTDEDGRTLMHCAAEYDQIQILELLMEYDHNLNALCLHGTTPLHSACRTGSRWASEFLVGHGADCGIRDNFGRTAFTVAWQYGHTEIMDLLRDRGTNREVDSRQDVSMDGLPAWALARLGRLDLITGSRSRLLDFSIKDPVTGYTALHCAIQCSSKTDHERSMMLQELLAIDPTYINEPNVDKQTPLHLTVNYSSPACAATLLRFHPRLDERDRYGNTPLRVVCNSGATFKLASGAPLVDIGIALVEAGAQIHEVEFAKQKLLFAAIERSNVKAVQNLIAAGADHIAPNEQGWTADFLAKRLDNGDGQILRILQSHRSFRYPVEKAGTIEASETEVRDEESPQEIPYRPFPGLEDGQTIAVNTGEKECANGEELETKGLTLPQDMPSLPYMPPFPASVGHEDEQVVTNAPCWKAQGTV